MHDRAVTGAVTAAEGLRRGGRPRGDPQGEARPRRRPLDRARRRARGCSPPTASRPRRVLVSKAHLAQAEPQAVVINSGVANAATGKQGELDALATAAEAAALLEPRSGAGARPLDRRDRRRSCRCRSCSPACARIELAPDGGADAAEAILTTDTYPKEAVVARGGFTVGGMAKGAGMIHPNLATMLAVVTTDYPLERGRGARLPQARRRRELQPDLRRRRVLDERRRDPARERRERDRAHRRRPTASSPPRSARSAPTSPGRSSRTARARPCCSRSRSRARRAPGEANAIAQADRHLAARQDRRVRARPELGPDPGRCRLGVLRRAASRRSTSTC